MADEGVQIQSLQARIAALNLGHIGKTPGALGSSSTISEAEQRPQVDQRSKSAVALPTWGSTSVSPRGEPNGSRRYGVLPPPTITQTGQEASRSVKPIATPRLPPRIQSSRASPALPPRRPSAPVVRRDSSESIASTVSNMSALSGGTARTSTSRSPSMDAGRMMAPAFDPSNLPPLPPMRSAQKVGLATKPVRGGIVKPDLIPTGEFLATKASTVPPRLPARRRDSSKVEKVLELEQPPPMPARPDHAFDRDKTRDQHDIKAGEKTISYPPLPLTTGVPPPIPLSSRPNLSSIQASKSRPAQNLPTSCLWCRDFSSPDTHAAKFPRHSVPSLDWLATQLAAPFPSPTDQARTIFTWLHHNISYDVVSFFNDSIKPSTPASTLSTGLAVCEGYAGLFTALASKVGLESVVVGGHGKGFGFADLPPGASLPPETSDHAWNAVKIDDGEWKLIDCCWGAGNISGEGKPYNRSFTPGFFTMSNDDFGLRHFPTNKSHFFRRDGRSITWEEYLLGDRGGELVRVSGGVVSDEGISETKFLPKHLHIPVSASKHPNSPLSKSSASTIRFQFERVCQHYDPLRPGGPGKPYVYILNVHGLDGRNKDYIPLQTDGMFWWTDVSPQLLGAPGQTVTLYTVQTVQGSSARGMTLEGYRAAKGRKAMSFGGVAAWELI